MTHHPFHRPDIELEDNASTTHDLRRDLNRLISATCTVIDVGSNRGQFATEILEIRPEANIYCFEPVEEAFVDLFELSRQVPNIHPYKKAVSRENGSATFYVTVGDEGSSLLEPIAGQPSKWLTTRKKEIVETIRLEQFISENLSTAMDGSCIDLLKTDAQGADLEVILSAGKYLTPTCIKAVLTEVNFANFYNAQYSFQDILAAMDKAGYRLGWFYPHRAHDMWLWWADALFIAKR